MKLGICVYTEDVASAERAGYDYVELTVTHVVPEVSESAFKALKRKLSAFSIRPEAWRRFLPSSLSVVGTQVDLRRVARYLETTLARVAELGGRVVVFGSPGARNVPPGFSRETAHRQMIEFLRIAADKAARNEITIVIEPILRKNCNTVNSVPEAVTLARDVAREEVKVLADLYHMTSEREPVEAIKGAGGVLHHVHLPVPQIPGMGEPRAITDQLPDYPVDAFLGQLGKLRYNHRISVEDLDRKFMNLEREAPLVLAYLRKRWEEVSQGVDSQEDRALK
jgi:sugar phosphate isomerase/epimerase